MTSLARCAECEVVNYMRTTFFHGVRIPKSVMSSPMAERCACHAIEKLLHMGDLNARPLISASASSPDACLTPRGCYPPPDGPPAPPHRPGNHRREGVR